MRPNCSNHWFSGKHRSNSMHAQALMFALTLEIVTDRHPVTPDLRAIVPERKSSTGSSNAVRKTSVDGQTGGPADPAKRSPIRLRLFALLSTIAGHSRALQQLQGHSRGIPGESSAQISLKIQSRPLRLLRTTFPRDFR